MRANIFLGTTNQGKITYDKGSDVLSLGLNNNSQIWVNAAEHFGKGFGILNEENTILEVHCETIGKYNILLIGTRKDEGAITSFNKKGLIWKSSDGSKNGDVEEVLFEDP